MTDEQLQQLQEMLDQQFRHIERRLDVQEELLANLMIAYTEVSSAMETTIAEVMAPRSEEERAEFRRSLDERHAKTLQMIQEVSREVDRSAPNDPAATAGHVAAEEPGDPPVG